MGKRKSPSISGSSRKRARQPSTSSPMFEAVMHGPACAEDDVYCTVCQKKEGDDFLLCDACDGGMHRQCAKLDHIPASGFWACTICKERPTVESAIRQVLHEHSISGFPYRQLRIKARERVPLGISGPEFAKGLKQALRNIDSTHFAREYRVIRLKDRYHLVTTAAADASSKQHLLPDSEDEQSSIRSSHTLRSADDSPSIHGKHVRHRISHSSSSSRQHSCPVEPPAFKGHQQEGTGSGGSGHASAHDSARVRSSFNQQHCHSYQKPGIADTIGADISHQGALSLAAAESVISGQVKGGSVEKHSAHTKTRGDSMCQEASAPCFASSACHAPAALVQTDLNQQQSTVTEPQSSGIQACIGSTGLQQQQDSSLDVSSNIGPAHLCTCLALAGLARFHAHTAATAVGFMAAYIQHVQMQWQHNVPCPDTRSDMGTLARKGSSPEPLGCKSVDLLIDSADEQLEAQTIEAPPANAAQELSLQQATSSAEQSVDVPMQLPSAEDPTQGAACFLSTMNHGDVMTMSAQLQRSRLFKAASHLVGLGRYTKIFEQHLDTLTSDHAARVVHTVCARIMASSTTYTPDLAGIFIQQYWQSLAAC